VQFKWEGGPVTTTADAHIDFNVVNSGAAPQLMTPITLRWYYTAQNVLPTPTTDCQWFVPGACPTGGITMSSTPAAKFLPLMPAKATADSYIEFSFKGVTILTPGALELRVVFHNTTGMPAFDLTKDYSFTAADTAYQDAPHCPLYYNGVLLWGTPP
jgi:hypothetical protein